MQMQRTLMKRVVTRWLAVLIILCLATVANNAAIPAATNCNPAGFLKSVWQDLLGRAISTEEKTFFLNFLNRGGGHAQVAQLVSTSVEYRTKLAQRLYQQFLGRAASQAEINVFLPAVQQGATVEQLIAMLVSSTEYYQNRGGGTVNGFLGQLYQDLLNRPPDEGGLAFFTNLMGKGGTRLQVAQLILSSSEYRTGQVQSFFKTFLQRMASDSELNFFLTLWQQGARREQLIAQIVGSPEYCELASQPSRNRQP